MQIAKELGDYYCSKKQIFTAKTFYQFNASNGWFEKWTKRYRLALRNRTSQEAPINLKKPFETSLKIDLERFYIEVDETIEKIEKKIKRE